MESWHLPEIETPGGSRSPVVLKSEDEARAVLIGLEPGQSLGDHQVKEHLWLLVVEGRTRIRAGNEEIDLQHPGIDTVSPDWPPDNAVTREVNNSCRVAPAELPGVVTVSATGMVRA